MGLAIGLFSRSLPVRQTLVISANHGLFSVFMDQTYNADTPQNLAFLLGIVAPEEPAGFRERWQKWRQQALLVEPLPMLRDTGSDLGPWRVFDLEYHSTNEVVIGGWLLRPRNGISNRGLIVGHGYGGRSGPDFDIALPDSTILFYCARGISRSVHPRLPSNPDSHVLHGIDDPEGYILRGCVEDVWLAVSALLRLEPGLAGHLGYLGISFGGGVGALALPFEDRIQRAHLNVPTFGHHPLRMTQPSWGSARAVQDFARQNPGIAESTLQWFDAAVAARHIQIPVHCACAFRDPVVAPVGQFAIYNQLAGPRNLFLLEAGHMEYPGQSQEEQKLRRELCDHFASL
jgi:cephalosporin-C deacetylase